MQDNNLPIKECYRVLDLNSGDTFLDAKKKYKKLIQKNHPDRFPSNSRAGARAEEQLLLILKAYRQIKNYSNLYGTMPLEQEFSYDAESFEEEIKEERQNNTQSDKQQKNSNKNQTSRGQYKSPAEALLAKASTLTGRSTPASNHDEQEQTQPFIRPKFLIISIALLAGLAGFVVKISSPPSQSAYIGISDAEMSTLEAKESQTHSLDKSINEDIVDELEDDLSENRFQTKTELMLMQTQSAETFSYGSSYTRVAKIHGPPDQTEDNTWYYGKSSVTFVDGTVSQWKSHPTYPLSARQESL